VNINATILAQMLIFAALVWFTVSVVWPWILEPMAAREKRIADGLAAAEEGGARKGAAGRRECPPSRERDDRAGEIGSEN